MDLLKLALAMTAMMIFGILAMGASVSAWNRSCGRCKGYPDQEPDPECPICRGRP